MNISPIPIAIMAAGGLMLYGGIRNRNPLDVVKLALSNGDLSKAKPLYTPSGGGGGIGGPNSHIIADVGGALTGGAIQRAPAYNPKTDPVFLAPAPNGNGAH